MKRVIAIALLMVFMSGCSHLHFFHHKKKTPIPVVISHPSLPSNGAIYQEASANTLWETPRAKKSGDILTVVLQESTSSSKTSKTGINKNASIDLPAPTLLGATKNIVTNLDSQRTFKGDAQADQSNRLDGLITVTVTDVMPNGTLMIQGEKRITLTRGEELIRITGSIRPADIGPDNSVLSSKVANSRITYSGTGEFADSNHVGWLTRIFNSPFWPF